MPKQLLFGWLPETRPAHGPRLRWKDRVRDELKLLGISLKEWYQAAQHRQEWRMAYQAEAAATLSQAPRVTCDVCRRSFSNSGFKRHKCTADHELPVQDQPGAKQCVAYKRWLRSAGGLAVHMCTPTLSSLSATELLVDSADRMPAVGTLCCHHHCSQCNRCFKSAAGFRRHNCQRGTRRKVGERKDLPFHCTQCDRRFARAADMARHKCPSSTL